ncbi:MAG: type IV pili twitching motility protein PilT, partial [Acidobacteria bacterium]
MTVQTPAAPAAEQQPAFSLNDLLIYMAKQEASDLHLKPMRPPLVRIRGKLIPIKTDPLKPADLEKMLLPILNKPQREKFDANLSVDIGYGVPGVARFRANLYMQRGTVGGVFRRIPIQIIGIDQLELPRVIHDMTQVPDGLVLVTGPTGSGKSTTLAAMISEIAEKEPL